jgi:hypothetical protein
MDRRREVCSEKLLSRGDSGLDTVAETARWLEAGDNEWFREHFDEMGYKAYS